ncbi:MULTISPECIES: BMP family ABC transporter substrate-binding protein [Paraburkholderia]|uniref:Purine-binding protein n=2 Tax=Paraburkholderia TaxID=1822464 RepID=A0A6J5FNB3_9BURK|nr:MULTISPECIES: BMP family ABC transporter substrate-binding protein [Paraburkholderia]GGC64987.1 BMP family ABC transporter substrate-binding protein [Paraburkholderia caffeinilytica]CAB3781954.1 Purine-binding protein [Paraburkholderia caffeinitolerans]CAB3802530.1 Purine-binding protein [Paraburkholderia caffeinilytica]
MLKIYHGALRHTALALLALQCLVTSVESDAAPAPLDISVVYFGNPGDGGWTHSHEVGIAAAEKQYGNQIKVTRVENVPESADASRVFRNRASQGDKVIIGTAFGYMNPMLQVARDYPDTVFLNSSGYKSAPNLGTYNGRVYEAEYLAGVLAGQMSKSHVLGFIGSMPIPEVVRNINAFALGARSVAPNTVVKVLWINSWWDPGKEKQAAETLIGLGADVLTQNTDSTAMMSVAEDHKVYAFGFDSDMSKWGPKAQIGSIEYNWGLYYVKVIDEIQHNTWTNKPVYWGVKEGMVDLTHVSASVPEQVQQVTRDARESLKSGRLAPFTGPIKDDTGKIRIEAGKSLSDDQLGSMNWFVDGVQGKLAP